MEAHKYDFLFDEFNKKEEPKNYWDSNAISNKARVIELGKFANEICGSAPDLSVRELLDLFGTYSDIKNFVKHLNSVNSSYTFEIFQNMVIAHYTAPDGIDLINNKMFCVDGADKLRDILYELESEQSRNYWYK